MVGEDLLVPQPLLFVAFLSLGCLWRLLCCFDQWWADLLAPLFHCGQVQGVLICWGLDISAVEVQVIFDQVELISRQLIDLRLGLDFQASLNLVAWIFLELLNRPFQRFIFLGECWYFDQRAQPACSNAALLQVDFADDIFYELTIDIFLCHLSAQYA